MDTFGWIGQTGGFIAAAGQVDEAAGIPMEVSLKVQPSTEPPKPQSKLRFQPQSSSDRDFFR